MVFQNYALYPHMTVRDNIGYALRVAGDDKATIARGSAKPRDSSASIPISTASPNLSGGQRQRVAIGRALVRHPQVFLFDEPLSNLDAKLRGRDADRDQALQRRLGTTAVYVTHDQVEAMTMADRVVVMQAGIIQQVAAPITLYERPANRFVAGFIGSPAMNLLSATFSQNGASVNGLTSSVPVTACRSRAAHDGPIFTIFFRHPARETA